jgi:glycosyltransferase involved in cell wall biosynthesis
VPAPGAEMRVLFVIAHVDKGGGQAVQALQLVRALRPAIDGEFIGLTATGTAPGTIQEGALEVVGALKFPRGITNLRREIEARRGRYDLVQVFDPYYSLPAARLARVRPLVVRLGAHPVEDLASRYGVLARLGLGLLNPWLYSGTHVVVNADHLAPAFGRRRVTVIPNGVDISRFSVPPDRSRARQAFGLPQEAPVATFIGKLIPRKNIEELYGALRQVPGLHLLLVGTDQEPYYGDRYHRAIRAAHADVLDRVHPVGEVPTDRIPDCLAAANIFLFPSRLEGMPNALLEAMAAGLPVLAANTPAHRAIVPDPDEQLYDSFGDLVRKLRAQVVAPTMGSGQGSRNRKWVEDRFSLRTAAEAYLRVYRSLLSPA